MLQLIQQPQSVRDPSCLVALHVVPNRCYQLQVVSIEGADASAPDEWGEFLHLPGQKFFDFAEIEAEIVRETDRATGRNKVQP